MEEIELDDEQEAALDRAWKALDEKHRSSAGGRPKKASGATAHLNLDRSDSPLTGGEWKTIRGARVYIKDGSVIAGPAHLKGRTEADVAGHGTADSREKPGYVAIERDAAGNYVGTRGKDGSVAHVAEHADRLKNLKIAPGYSKVHLAEDPQAMRQAYQTDAKGRETRVYSDAHSIKQSAAKFARVKKFVARLPEIRKSIAGSPSEEAAALRLIDETGIRIGSDANTGADKKAFGATTLNSSHVVTTPEGGTALDFTGKKGVHIRQEIADERLANELKDRAKSGGKLYNTSDAKVRDYLHGIAPGFKVKDFRTAVAADTAMKTMSGMAPPASLAELVKARKAVGDTVAAKLGNTGTVALKSYIPPEVFSGWESKAANLEQAKLIESHAEKTGMNPGEAAKDWIQKNAKSYRDNFNRKLGKAGKPGTNLSRGVGELPGRTNGGFGGADRGIRRGSERRIAVPVFGHSPQYDLDRSESPLTGGEWVTIKGQHIYLVDGVAQTGPFKGKKLSEIHESHALDHEHQARKSSRAASEAHAAGKDNDAERLQAESTDHLHKAATHRVSEFAARKNEASRSAASPGGGRSTTGKARTPFDMHDELQSSLGLGKLTVPLNEHGEIDPHLEEAYRSIADRKGFKLGEFKKGTRNATATVDRAGPSTAAGGSPLSPEHSIQNLESTNKAYWNSFLNKGREHPDTLAAKVKYDRAVDAHKAMVKETRPTPEPARKEVDANPRSDIPSKRTESKATKPASKPAPQSVVKPRKPKTVSEYSKAGLEKSLIGHHEAMGGGYTAHDESALEDAAGSGHPFTFHDSLPAEVKDFVKDNPATRSMFSVTNDARKAGGADAFSALGDRYFDIAAAKAGSPLRAALKTAESGQDPSMQLKAAIYRTMPDSAKGLQAAATKAKARLDSGDIKSIRNAKTPEERASAIRSAASNVADMQARAQHAKEAAVGKETVAAEHLKQGDSFKINGHPVTVTVDEDEHEILKDHGSIPETPLDAIHGMRIPIDKGSLKHEEESSAGDFEFGDSAGRHGVHLSRFAIPALPHLFSEVARTALLTSTL